MNEIFREMLFPVLLGDGYGLRQNAARIGQFCNTAPLALTRHPHPFLTATSAVRGRRLSGKELPFLCDLLAAIAENEEDRILYLVPCTPAFRRFVDENRRFLDEYYICAGEKDPVGTFLCRTAAGRGQA